MRADEDKKSDRKTASGVDRRTFIAKGLIAGGAALGGGLAISRLADANDGSAASQTPPPASAGGRTAASRRPVQPNILVIIVDQLRYPAVVRRRRARRPACRRTCAPARRGGLVRPPLHGLQRLHARALGAADRPVHPPDRLHDHRRPARSNPGFPTWGTMLREHGYHTCWYGKWHLTHGDNRWTPANGARALERYGFSGGTYPSPDGAPGQGWRVDPRDRRAVRRTGSRRRRRRAVVHDGLVRQPPRHRLVVRWSDRVPAEARAPSVVDALPPNFETPEQLIERGKPRAAALAAGHRAPSFGAGAVHRARSRHRRGCRSSTSTSSCSARSTGRSAACCDALESRPEVAANTVVVFTSDHGEYGASHGLRGKGAGAYEEGIRVPLIVTDPRGELTRAPERARTQLTSSVDVAPLLLTIASGSNAWRARPHYAHIAGRLDLAASSPTPPRRAAPTCCTPPTRS